MPKRIVILGAGFAGIQAAVELDRALGRSGEIEILLISDQNYFLFTPLLPQIASSNIDPRHIAQAIRDLRGAGKFRFLRASVSSVDLVGREVHTDSGQSDPLSTIPIPYDYLIFAPGSRTDYFGIPGARENTLDFKSLEDAVVLRERMLDICEHADHTSGEQLRRKLLTFVVVGGGYTGIELVTEWHDLLFGYVAKRYRGISAGDIR